MHMYSFASLIRRTPPPTFSDTAITDCHSDTTIFQLRAHWVRISWSIGSEKSFRYVPPVGRKLFPLTQCILVDYSTIVCWTSPFVILGVLGLFCHFYTIFYGKILLANNVDPDQKPHNVASDLGLHCLPMTLIRVS